MPSPITPPFTADAISQVIEQDIDSCQTLLGFLEEEQKAVSSKDLDKLEAIIRAKAEALQKLEKSAHIRTEWVKLHGSQPGDAEEIWQQVLKQFPDNIKERWQVLKTLIATCKEKNEVNGRAVSRNQQTFSKILGILRGQQQHPDLYTSAGASNTGTSKSHLGEA